MPSPHVSIPTHGAEGGKEIQWKQRSCGRAGKKAFQEMGTSNCVSFRVTPRNSCGSVKIKRFLERKSSLVSGFALPLGLSFNFSLLLPQGWWPLADGCLIKGLESQDPWQKCLFCLFWQEKFSQQNFLQGKKSNKKDSFSPESREGMEVCSLLPLSH